MANTHPTMIAYFLYFLEALGLAIDAFMVNPSQIRAARGLLNISQTELARRAGVGVATIKKIETGAEIPE